MTIEVIGGGLGRTGTLSLKLALERLLAAPCHHMVDFFNRPQQARVWTRALERRAVNWNRLFNGYRAAVDWTAAAFLPELSAAFPDAIVLLSVRDVDAWWRSYRDTIVRELRSDAPDTDTLSDIDTFFTAAYQPVREFTVRMLETRFTPEWMDETAAKEAFEAHNAAVRATVPPDRLVEWRPGDGWVPLSSALGVATPDEPFPHANTTSDFWDRNFLTERE